MTALRSTRLASYKHARPHRPFYTDSWAHLLNPFCTSLAAIILWLDLIERLLWHFIPRFSSCVYSRLLICKTAPTLLFQQPPSCAYSYAQPLLPFSSSNPLLCLLIFTYTHTHPPAPLLQQSPRHRVPCRPRIWSSQRESPRLLTWVPLQAQGAEEGQERGTPAWCYRAVPQINVGSPCEWRAAKRVVKWELHFVARALFGVKTWTISTNAVIK